MLKRVGFEKNYQNLPMVENSKIFKNNEAPIDDLKVPQKC